MTKYVIEKTFQVIIDDDDFAIAGGKPCEQTALEIADEIPHTGWEQVGVDVVGISLS